MLLVANGDLVQPLVADGARPAGNDEAQGAAVIGLEVTAGLSFGLSMLVLQFGLLVALIRYRLYDAEAVISRTASTDPPRVIAVSARLKTKGKKGKKKKG